MGTRGRRSAADMAIMPGKRQLTLIDLDTFGRHHADRREAQRALVRMERQGRAVRQTGPDGVEQWFEVT